ncbi:hypothetical protein LOD99_7707 [Oopsacas minuta]|uniref:Uncharacterized protein n=1 Tax=Oopsacas minuta TaxID=111878 RepID=A0AAV7JNV2_9METZ|nr:hypothetical protein LOD99_7707 [Oopsacas minuta]
MLFSRHENIIDAMTTSAERFPEFEVPLIMKQTEASINEKFSYLIFCINKRRVELIAEFKQRQERRQLAEIMRTEKVEELIESKAQLQSQPKK